MQNAQRIIKVSALATDLLGGDMFELALKLVIFA